jgi:hypothetical protein
MHHWEGKIRETKLEGTFCEKCISAFCICKKQVIIFVDKQYLAEFLEWCILHDKDIYDAEARLETSEEFINRNVE